MTATQRSARLMRSEGWRVAFVEQTIRARAIVFKRDLFGIGDLLCVRLRKTRIIQTTIGMQNFHARVRKIRREKAFKALKFANWQIEVHAWRLLKRTRRWEVKRIIL